MASVQRSFVPGQTLRSDSFKILAAFSIGLISFFGGPLVFSRLHRDYASSERDLRLEPRLSVSKPVTELAIEPEPKLDSSGFGGSPQQELLEQGWISELAALQTQQRPACLSLSRHPIGATAVDVPAPQPGPSTLRDVDEHQREYNPVGKGILTASPAESASHSSINNNLVRLPDTGVRPSDFTLPPETPIYVRMGEFISTKQNRKGETFRATLAAPLSASNFVIAEAGSAVLGRIVEVRKGGLFRSPALLDIELTDLATIDGKLTKIHTTQWHEGGSHNKLIDAAIAPAAFAGRAFTGAISGLSSGARRAESPDPSAVATTGSNDEVPSNKNRFAVPAGAGITVKLTQPLTVHRR